MSDAQRSPSGRITVGDVAAPPPSGPDRRTLSVGSSGERVRELHARMLDLGADVAHDELVAGMFGHSTRYQLLDLQRRLRTVVTGAADSEVLDALEGADAQHRRYVVVQVLGPDERPVAAATVEALDRDLRSSESLGKGVTGDDGVVVMGYDLASAARDEEGTADVDVRVRLGRKVVHEPSVDDTVFDAHVLVVVVVRLAVREAPSATQWQRVTEAVEPLLGELAWTDLAEDDQHRDITFLSRETGLDDHTVTAAALARRLGRTTDVEPQLFFAVLVLDALANAGRWASLTPRWDLDVGTDLEVLLDDLALLPAEVVKATVGRAVDSFVIDRSAAKGLDRLREVLDARVREATARAAERRKNVVTSHLTHLVESDVMSRVTALLADDPLGDLPGVVGRLVALDLVPQGPARDDSLGRLSLVELLGEDPELIDRVRTEHDITGLADSHRLAALSAQDWARTVSPTSGGREAATQARGALLAERMAARFPTTAFAARLADDANAPLPHAAEVAAALARHPEFDLARGRTAELLAADDVDLAPEAASTLVAAQRVFRVAPSYAKSRALMTQDVWSSQAVLGRGRQRFVREAVDSGAFDSAQALQAFDAASRIHTAALILAGQIQGAASATMLPALAETPADLSPVVADFPNMKSLFSTIDMCECPDCRSVHGAAAYLVDVLQFLGNRLVVDTTTTPATTLKAARDVLLARRPDLTVTDLDCANTNTPLPYLDVVCELLEEAVAPDPGVAFAGPVADGVVAPALLTALQGLGLAFTADTVVHGPDLDGGFVARDAGAVVGITPDGGGWRLRVLRQTFGSDAELAAAPAYVNAAAYAALAADPACFTLPLDLGHLETRAYFTQLGSDRAGLMSALGTASPAELAAERLGLSDGQHTLVVTPDPGGQQAIWTTPGSPASATLSNVDSFVTRSGRTYADLLELVDLAWVDGGQNLFVQHLDASADLGAKRVANLDDAALDRLHRFLRLRDAIRWPSATLDRALRSPMGGAGTLDDACLVQLDALRSLASALRTDADGVLDLLEPLDVDAPAALYARWFLDPTRLGTLEPAFDPAAVHANELAEAGTPGSGTRLATVAGALGLALGAGATETTALLAALDDPAITATSLGAALGRVRLARALRIPVADLLAVLALDPGDPFASPAACLAVVDRVAAVRASGVPPTTLLYLLRHEATDLTAFEMPTAPLQAFLTGLHAAYAAALAADASPFSSAATPEENTAAVRPFLARLGIPDADLSRLQTLLLDAWADTTTTEAALVTAVLGPLVDVTSIQAALVARAAAAEPKDPERNDVLEAVGSAVAQALYDADRRTALVEAAAVAFALEETDAATVLDHARLKEPPAAGDPLLADVLLDDGTTAAVLTAQENAARLVHTLALLSSRGGIDAGTLAWLLDDAAALGWAEPDHLPYAAGQPVTSFDAWERLRSFLLLAAAYPDVTDPVDVGTPFSLRRYEESLLAGATPGSALAELGTLTGIDPTVLVALDTHLGLSPADRLDPRTTSSLLSTAALLRSLGLDVLTAVTVAGATPTLADALTMRAAVRSRYADEEWLGVLKQIQDPLREAKRDALVAFLLAHNPDLRSSDDLYDWFLIDNQMTAGMTTSRIVQAHATVQLFAMRCLMGLEPKAVASVGTDDGWTQWDWMANFRVWEANRKIFLWPENWISPDLRDDRSEPFVTATDALAQDALTDTSIESATNGYLQTLEDVAHLDVRAAYYDVGARVEHVFARNRGGSPYVYYYRRLQRERSWTPWTTVPLDIGPDQLLAFSRNSRLTLAWPQFMQEPDIDSAPPDTPDPATLSGGKANSKPRKRWKVQLAVSELSDGHWREKRVSFGALYTDFSDSPPATSSFNFFVWGLGANQAVSCVGPGGYLGSFALTGCKGVPEAQQGGSMPGWLLPWFVNTDLQAGVFVEQGTSVGGELAVKDQPYSGPDQILAKTPAGVFGVTYPLQMTILDWLVLVLQVWAGQSGGTRAATHERRLALPLGTLLPWFYGDLARDYVVIPGFYPRRGRHGDVGDVTPDDDIDARKKTASNVFDLVDDVVALAMKYLAKYQADPSVPLADLVAELTADPDYLAIVDEVTSYKGLRYGMQIRTFWHPLVCAFRIALNSGGIPAMMARRLQLTDTGFDFAATYQPSGLVAPPYPREDVDFDLAGAYSSYNWELFYHLPMAMAARLSQDQQFEQARDWMHYVFNPVGAGTAPAPRRFWNTKPFFLATPADYLEQRIDTILGDIAADPSAATIGDLELAVTQWRERPFTPDVVARSRPVAYQMATVIAYVQNLVDWGDNLFRQFTRESVTQATQLYVLAGKLLGPKPRIVPPAVPVPPMTYDQLRGHIDIFGNALLDLETLVPDVTALPHGGAELPPAPATLTSLYFCIPPNEVLLAKWDLVADRLFKIRNCQNIDGVEASLALFSPPIDPGALARATAAGVDVSSFLASLGAPPPHYRFTTVAAKALELAQHVSGLGSALLAALEKRDGEQLSLLRQRQEITVLDALRQVKLATIDEATGALDALHSSAEVIQERIDFYASRDYMNPAEITATVLNGVSLLGEAGVALGYALAGGLSAIPDFVVGGAGFGGSPTAHVETGGGSFGKAAEQAAAMLSSLSRVADKSASLAATQGGYQRRMDDWDFQKALAERELSQLDVQIANAQLRLTTLAQDLKVHDLQTSNAKALDAAMRSKYTNRQLYSWMIGQVSATYYSAYKLAFDTAKKAERGYRFELATDQTFLKFGYWDSLRKGLLSAEGLVHDIQRMQVAYLDRNAREYELTKHVSLASIDPGALWQLRTTGKVTIQVPEAAFDLDHPNHYLRRLKTVSASLVCNAPSYATVGMTLSLVSNKYRTGTQPRAGAVTDHDKYAEDLGNDPRFAYNVGGLASVATSSAVSDSGLFELNFHDERYLPFEGAGAVSTWRIELPTAFQQFDHDTISDLVLHIRYTAREGGSAFRSMSEKALGAVLNESLLAAGRTGLYVAYSLRDSFPDAWWQLKDSGTTSITVDEEHLPWAVRTHSPTLTGVTWAAQAAGAPATFPITIDGTGTTLNRDATMTTLCVGTVAGAALGTPITVACNAGTLTDLSVLVAYTIA